MKLVFLFLLISCAGSLSKKVSHIGMVLTDLDSGFALCHENYLKIHNQDLEGDILLSFWIGPEGRPLGVEVESILPYEIQDCVEERIKKIKLKEPLKKTVYVKQNYYFWSGGLK